MTDVELHDEAPPRSWAGPARLAAGLAQGVVLYLLMEAAKQKVWPSTAPMLNAALWAVAVYTPLVKIEGMARLRLWTLSVWATAATAGVAGLATYSLWREAGTGVNLSSVAGLPSLPMIAGTGAALFILNALIAGGDADRRLVARYNTLFDIAWKQGLQLALASAFVGVFWVILLIGAALFKLVHIEALQQLLEKTWFHVPATFVAYAAALHLTDVRHSLIRGGRTLVLGLLSWLTPLLTALIIAFLATLPFTGLKPLWDTHHAAGLMFTAAVGLIFLINTIYQNGATDRPLVLRATVRAGAPAVAPLALIAGHAMGLRIDPYGLTSERVIAAALALIVVAYATAYAVCALKPKPWMAWMAPTNIGLALFSVAVILALLTPVADPAKLAVADQLHRLESGRTPVDKFDFLALKFKEARYGREALKTLAAKPGAVGEKAKTAMAADSYRTAGSIAPKVEPPEVRMHGGAGAPKPDFASDDWRLNDCHTAAACDGLWIRFPGAKAPSLVVVHDPVPRADLAAPGTDGKWRVAGSFTLCAGDREALLAGKAKTAPPAGAGDLVFGDRHVTFAPDAQRCPPPPQ